MHKVRSSEQKDAPSPSLVELPTAAKKTKKMKRALKKAALVATSAIVPPLIDFPLDDVSLADLSIPLCSRALTAEGSGDLLEGTPFMWPIVLLEE